MDLVKEFKTAVKNPLHFKNLFIIFLVTFITLIIALSMTVVFKSITSFSENTACDTPRSITTKGAVKVNSDSIYKIKFTGNEKCFIQAWFTWREADSQVNLWVYDPNGNVTIIEPIKAQSYINYTANSPILKGEWRLILKSINNNTVPYNGEIAVR